jgi:hypothetical protein
MQKNFTLVFTALVASTVAFGQVQVNPGIDIDAYQINYAANLNIGDSNVDITNTGIQGPFFGTTAAGPTAGNLCVNTYVFDPQEEEIGCCACLVTPNGLNSLSAKSDLISNNLTPAVPTSIVVKLVASQPGTDKTGAFTVCNPATLVPLAAGIPYAAGQTGRVAAGMRAWMNTLEPEASPGTYGVVHSSFLPSPLIDWELNALSTVCNFIQANGTGFGICKSCRLGALGGAKQ